MILSVFLFALAVGAITTYLVFKVNNNSYTTFIDKKKQPKTLLDLCIRKMFEFPTFHYYEDYFRNKSNNINKNLFHSIGTYSGQLWHLPMERLDLLFDYYYYMFMRLCRNMDYLADALVDIGKALFGTPCLLMRVLTSCLPMILLDIQGLHEVSGEVYGGDGETEQ